MLNDSCISSTWKRVSLYMLKDGENLKDNQRTEISIRTIKLSERKRRNRCIHSRIDVRANSVKGKLVGI